MRHATVRRHLAASVTALALIGLATGCGDDEEPARTPVPSSATGSADADGTASAAPGTPAAAPDTTAGVLAAVAAAERVAANSRVVSVDSDSDDVPQPLWEVVVVDEAGQGTEYRFAQADLAALDQRPEKLDPEERTAPTVEVRRAIEIALGAVPGEVRSLELGEEQGTVVWEVGVLDTSGARREVTIDAGSGEVLRSGRDD